MKLNYDVGHEIIPRSKYIDLIREFEASGRRCAEVMLPQGKDVQSCRCAMGVALRRYANMYGHIRVMMRGGALYLRNDAIDPLEV